MPYEEASAIFAAVLAAGKGTRMKSNRAKVLHTICGVPMVNYVIAALKPIGPQRTLVVIGHQADEVKAVLPPTVEPVLQKQQIGTGDAVRVALEAIEEDEGTLLVLNGDGPLISHRTLAELLERHRSAGVGATVLVAELDDATVVRIVEERNATEGEKQIRLLTPGLSAFDLKEIRGALALFLGENAQG